MNSDPSSKHVRGYMSGCGYVRLIQPGGSISGSLMVQPCLGVVFVVHLSLRLCSPPSLSLTLRLSLTCVWGISGTCRSMTRYESTIRYIYSWQMTQIPQAAQHRGVKQLGRPQLGEQAVPQKIRQFMRRPGALQGVSPWLHYNHAHQGLQKLPFSGHDGSSRCNAPEIPRKKERKNERERESFEGSLAFGAFR